MVTKFVEDDLWLVENGCRSHDRMAVIVGKFMTERMSWLVEDGCRG